MPEASSMKEHKLQIERLRQLAIEYGVDLDVSGEFSAVGASCFEQPLKFALNGGGGVFAAGKFRARGVEITVEGKGSALVIAEGAELYRTKIQIRGRNNIIFIGANARIKRALLSTSGNDNTMALGARLTWESGASLCGPDGQSILVGNGCMFSNNVILRTSDGHGIFDRDSGDLLNMAAPVIIEQHVWIGNGARCNKGVHIREGSVLGGASIATGTLDAKCIYAGVPARKKRENIAWSRTYNFDDVPTAMLQPTQAQE